ncbi:MAG TPA: peptidase M16, partial [Marinilabiliales bacterium]|nr:peptidase M16 [Marinilabiliales bacterium]
VVIEEFKQRYLNQPYGDWNLLLRPMTYKVHPYQWPTIGKEISHIENATLEEVKEFFFGFYAPNNAILSVAGNITKKEVETLAEKWFGPIPRRNILKKKIPQEPKQTEARKEIVQRPVPVNAIYQAFHMCGRNHDDYYATDLISDILSNGKSSRMNQKLVKEQKFFSSISAYITGDVDPGLFIVNGNLNPGVTFEQAETAIRQELDHLMHGKVEENELAKVKNKVEANLVYSEINILNKAMNLAYFEHLGDASIINQETQKYQQVTPVDIQRVARNIFQNSNCSTLNYQVQPS